MRKFLSLVVCAAVVLIVPIARAQVPTVAPALTYKQALMQENKRYSQEWHKRGSEIQYEEKQKEVALKNQYVKDYHSTSDPKQRLAYRNKYDQQVGNSRIAAQNQWKTTAEGLTTGHDYNIEQIKKLYGVPY